MFSKLNNSTIVSVYEPVDLPIIDNDELAIELDVVNLASEAAKANRPDSSASQSDSNEINFRHKVESKGIQAANKVKQSTDTLKNKISSISISSEISEIKKFDNEFDKQSSLISSKKLNDIAYLKKQYLEAEKDLKNFKKENNIARGADYPDSHIFTVSLLFAALIIESVCNGLFFAEGSDFGLIGGILYAIVIAFINIALGFLNGWWVFRYKNHQSAIKVTIFTAIFLIICLSDFFLNLLVAHYREALVIDPDSATSMAVKSFQQGMFQVSDVESWFLFLIGMIFFSLAVYKGYAMDDAYPGYGNLARRRDDFYNEFLDEKDSAIDLLEAIHLQYEKKLNECYDQANRKLNQLDSFISSIDHQITLFDSYILHLESALKYIISYYRDINISERNTPPPHYFKEQIKQCFDNSITVEYIDVRQKHMDEMSIVSELLPDIRGNMLSLRDKYQKQIEHQAQV